MNKTTIINIVILWLAICFGAWGLVAQNKVNANEEILALQKRNIELEARNAELDKLIQDEKDWWWVDEDAKTECITSWESHQNNRTKVADWYRAEQDNNNLEIEKNKERLGLLLQSQLQ